jgi:hypothetical protein
MPIPPSIQDCPNIGWDQQIVYGDRYLAKIVPAFAICVYTVPDSHLYQCQCFPSRDTYGGDHTISREFIQFVGRMSGPTNDDTAHLRKVYPFFTAPDVLTLKCIAEEAAQAWREDRCSTSSQR